MEEGRYQDIRLGDLMRRLIPALGVLLTACTTSGQGSVASQSAVPAAPKPSHSHSRAHSSATSPAELPTRSPAASSTAVSPPRVAPSAQQVFARMTERQRVGQLLMVDCSTTSVSPATVIAIDQYAVGAVILDGTSFAGIAETRAVTSQLQRVAPPHVKLLISTDQEGGLVQRLQGPGFTRIVSAVQQGTIPPTTLQGYAHGWGDQLRSAGVNVNLAPVLDTVPAGFGSNPPIGDLDREFGHTPAVVTAHGLAVARGMAAARVAATVKHFPGLGRVRGNTDTTRGVTDTVTTRHDAYLAPFRAAAQAGVPFVMMSTAIYSRIDPGVPAAFSSTIVTGMLRGDLGFHGLVISDDLGAAKAVSAYAIGTRAVKFVAAGGDVVLTVDANEAADMTRALLSKANSDSAFRSKVNDAALRVLQEKHALGLLT
jgi:beta-N-acetylhexosaminidase